MSVNWPKTEQELIERIREALGQVSIKTMEEYKKAGDEERKDSYNAVPEALTKVALEAFNYAAEVLGPSGFQADYAALHLYREVMHIKCPFMVIRAEDMLYPQYNIEERVHQQMMEWMPWVIEQATEKLAGNLEYVHPGVKAYWRALVERAPRGPVQ